MASVRYTVMDGEILSENRAGVERDYVPDPLGSTVALLDNTQTKTDTWVYWPYGEVKTHTGTNATAFQFVGTLGYYQDSSTRTYVRARHLDTQKGRWMTEDPIGFDGGDWNLSRYARNSPVSAADSSGLSQCPSGTGGCSWGVPSFPGIPTGFCGFFGQLFADGVVNDYLWNHKYACLCQINFAGTITINLTGCLYDQGSVHWPNLPCWLSTSQTCGPVTAQWGPANCASLPGCHQPCGPSKVFPYNTVIQWSMWQSWCATPPFILPPPLSGWWQPCLDSVSARITIQGKLTLRWCSPTKRPGPGTGPA